MVQGKVVDVVLYHGLGTTLSSHIFLQSGHFQRIKNVGSLLWASKRGRHVIVALTKLA
jgi:hypothetical protein